MPTPDILPIPHPLPPTLTHEHAWLVESRHPTSDGTVLYVRCAGCDTRRVDLLGHAQTPPSPVSRTIAVSPERRR